jgi:hypothetical protein
LLAHFKAFKKKERKKRKERKKERKKERENWIGFGFINWKLEIGKKEEI